MFASIQRIVRKSPVLSVIFVTATVLFFVFSLRAILFAFVWSNPVHHEVDLSGWMTVRYVSHSWKVPPEVVRRGLGLTRDDMRFNLDHIAAERGVPLDEFMGDVQEILDDHLAKRP